MFVHNARLEHLLRPADYVDPSQYQAEVERLFLPAWHLVASRSEVPRHGDFRTLELLGRPIQARNIDGTIHAFLNVCPHRPAILTGRPRGNDPHFRCQYHGWEYTAEGRTARIPDARCFRPFDRENAQLVKYPVELCGDLIFVKLTENGPTLREFLGEEFHRTLAASFAPPYRPAWVWEADIAANWKVPIENTLEMYHIPIVHPKTLGTWPPEETVTHDLSGRSTTLRTVEHHPNIAKLKAWLVRRLGETPSPDYTHHHTHPNTVYIGMDTFRLAEVFVPTSPTTCRQRVWLHVLRGGRNGPVARAMALLLRKLAVSTTRRILTEDLPIFPQQQRGMASSPHRGVIGTIEERIHTFHEYVRANAGTAHDGRPRSTQAGGS